MLHGCLSNSYQQWLLASQILNRNSFPAGLADVLRYKFQLEQL
ncbi:hypothetical protein D019_1236 [Vibrio parahaemolyticus VP2007-095]|nr:hypothetical protein D019_1236 [Vibrio parahaemolyticus VP2007-095]